jgi:hypothetical protein
MGHDFDPLATRRMYLAGTVPFPAPFPTVGTVTNKNSKLVFPVLGEVAKPTLIVEDPVRFDNKVVRTVFLKDVAALFVPEAAEDNCCTDPCGKASVNFEKGKWYLGEEVAGVGTDGKPFPGIVFVVADASVLSRIDLTLPAAETCLIDLSALPVLLRCGCLCCPHRP